MKRNNYLFKVTYQGKTHYFTKNAYITRLTGLQNVQIERAKIEKDYAKKYDIKIETIDGSEIKYKDINVI